LFSLKFYFIITVKSEKFIRYRYRVGMLLLYPVVVVIAVANATVLIVFKE